MLNEPQRPLNAAAARQRREVVGNHQDSFHAGLPFCNLLEERMVNIALDKRVQSLPALVSLDSMAEY